jgi:predicted molibdopterin-dependent oxidoreductase YjgC
MRESTPAECEQIELHTTIFITIDGRALQVAEGTTVAAAILQAGAATRRSVHGEPRQPLCGMGICYECRAQVDGEPHQRTCQILCRAGMRVITG